jgi:replicative DNA helicase
MDIPASLFTRIATDPDAIIEVINSGVTTQLFTLEDQKIWEYCHQYYQDFGGAPSKQAIITEFPEYDRWYSGHEPVSWYVHELRRTFKQQQLLKMTREIAISLKKSDDPALIIENTVRSRLLEIDALTSESTDHEWSSAEARQERVDRYETIKNNQGRVGIITPFPTLNQTFQFRREGLYIIVARQGVGKTWLLTRLAHHAHVTENKSVLVDTREMPIEQISARLDSITFHVSSDQIARGDLDFQAESKWRKDMLSRHNYSAPFNIIEETGGVSAVAAKMEKYNADSVWIDGAYMIPDERGTLAEYQQITNVCRDLKRLAKRTKTVIVITLQFNRQATNTEGDASNIALGDVAKEADGILGLFRSEDQRFSDRATLKVLKNRHAQECEPVELDWQLESGNITEVDHPVDFGHFNSKTTTNTTPQPLWEDDTDEEVQF